MKPKAVIFAAILGCLIASTVFAAGQSPLLGAMKTELDRSMGVLRNADQVPLYYLSYHVTDTDRHSISASYGAIMSVSNSRERVLDIDCRVGDAKLDNTHEIRGESDFDFNQGGSSVCRSRMTFFP